MEELQLTEHMSEKIENTYKFPRNGKRKLREVQWKPNQQAFEDVVPVPSYLELLRVELCQEVPLLVVELDNYFVPQMQTITTRELVTISMVLYKFKEDNEWVGTKYYKK